MTFVVIFIALLIERFFDWSHLRHWGWFKAFQGKVAGFLASKSPYVTLGITIVSLVLAVLLIEFVLNDFLYGLPRFLFTLFILIYCLGPKNLWADTFADINRLTEGADAQMMKEPLDPEEKRSAQTIHRHFLKQIFIEAHTRVFAVIFWFFVFGPAGALLYRTAVISTEPTEPLDTIRGAEILKGILDWLPVRVFTLFFALSGHFTKVIAHWPHQLIRGIDSNQVMLVECGFAALGLEGLVDLPEDGSMEKNALALIDRTLIIVLVVVAVVALFVIW